MDINLIRSLITLALFVLFILLFYFLFNKKSKRHFEEVSKTIFEDGDERTETINPNKSKV